MPPLCGLDCRSSTSLTIKYNSPWGYLNLCRFPMSSCGSTCVIYQHIGLPQHRNLNRDQDFLVCYWREKWTSHNDGWQHTLSRIPFCGPKKLFIKCKENSPFPHVCGPFGYTNFPSSIFKWSKALLQVLAQALPVYWSYTSAYLKIFLKDSAKKCSSS